MKSVYLSLGSNVGDRLSHIRTAIDRLATAGLEIRRVSSFYRTEPVDFRPQPWFVNCVAEVGTELMPLQLLKALQSVERSLGRRPGSLRSRGFGRRGVAKGPRPIDIDILLYENVVVRSSVLTIPHERMSGRRFVLIPLRELAARARHPVTQRTVLEMLHETTDSSQVVRLKAEC